MNERLPQADHKIEFADCFDLGTFEGFNFRQGSAIQRCLTAAEVVSWDHDKLGEAEFWPAGDRPEVARLFRGQTAVTGSEIVSLEKLLTGLGGDSSENFMRILHAVNVGGPVDRITKEIVEDQNPHIFLGTNFIDLRQKAAYELFELYYPEEYAVWEKSTCDGLHFDTDRFLDSPSLSVEEVELDDQTCLIVVTE